jgi:hypothetical protein
MTADFKLFSLKLKPTVRTLANRAKLQGIKCAVNLHSVWQRHLPVIKTGGHHHLPLLLPSFNRRLP